MMFSPIKIAPPASHAAAPPTPKPDQNAATAPERFEQALGRARPKESSARTDEQRPAYDKGPATPAHDSAKTAPSSESENFSNDSAAAQEINTFTSASQSAPGAAEQTPADAQASQDEGQAVGKASAQATGESTQAGPAGGVSPQPAGAPQAQAAQAAAAALANGAAPQAVPSTIAGAQAQATEVIGATPDELGGAAEAAAPNAAKPAKTSADAQADTADDGAKPARHGRPAPSLSATLSAALQHTDNASAAGVQPAPPSSADVAAAPPQASAPLPLPSPDTDANLGRVVRGLQGAVNQNGGTVTLRLVPPDLGVVRIRMMVQDGVVRAEMLAQNESVRQLLTQQLGHLRSALENQGLTVDRLHVQISAPAAANAGANPGGPHLFEQQHEAPQQGNDGRSRGEYAGGDSPPRDPRHTPAGPNPFEEELIDTLA